VDWTVVGGKLAYQTQSHHTEKAARRHVANLLESRVERLSVEDVYREDV
jgi:hypothetical protein